MEATPGPPDGEIPLRDRVKQVIDGADLSCSATTEFVERIWPELRLGYKRLTRRLHRFCSKNLADQNLACTITSRVKTVSSTRKTLAQRETKHKRVRNEAKFTMRDVFQEMHDLAGLRIVVELPTDMDAVKRFVQETFHEEKTPNIFLTDRRTHEWKALFGAYKTCNYRVSYKPQHNSTGARRQNYEARNSGKGKQQDRDDDDEEGGEDEDGVAGGYDVGENDTDNEDGEDNEHNNNKTLSDDDAGVMFEVQVVSLAESLYGAVAHDLLYKGYSGPLDKNDQIVLDLGHGSALCYGLAMKYFEEKLKVARRSVTEDTPVDPGMVANGKRMYRDLSARLPPDRIPPNMRELSVPCDVQTSVSAFQEWVARGTRDVLEQLHSIMKEQLTVAQKQHQTAQQQLVATHIYHDEGLIDNCLQALRQVNGNIGYEWYKNRAPERVEGTCNWFLEQDALKAWLEQDTSGVLLVTADPGCGKTVLSRFLIEAHLPDVAPNVPICYFFFKNPDQARVGQALCAILHQLLSNRRDLLAVHAVNAFRSNGPQLAHLTAVMWMILTKIREDHTTGPLFIVIDGLEECEESAVTDLLNGLRMMLRRPGGSRVKVLLTSRPYGRITEAMSHLGAILHIPGEKESDAISNEVNLVINDRVKKLTSMRNLSDNLADHLREGLKKTEHRTYLWVYLAFEMLMSRRFNQTQSGIDDLLESIPRSYAEAYEEILRHSHNTDMVRCVLSIILAALRPLTVAEMNAAVHAKLKRKTAEDKQTINGLDLELSADFEMRLRDSCGLFVAVNGGRVYFLHQTAREFLLSDTRIVTPRSPLLQWHQSISMREADSILAEACVHFLEIFRPSSDPPDFLVYAAMHWPYHVRRGAIMARLESSILGICDASCSSHRLRHSICLEADRDYKDMNTAEIDLFLGVFIGSEALVRKSWQAGANINVVNGLGETPLISAVQDGHESIVSFLLDAGADVNLNSTTGDTALTKAAKMGDAKICKLLLNSGANVNREDSEEKTALFYAILKLHRTMAELLLRRGACPTEVDLALNEMNGFVVKPAIIAQAFRMKENAQNTAVKPSRQPWWKRRWG